MAEPTSASADRPESGESLWMLAAAPALWAAHFLACYITAAVWCAKAGGAAALLGPVRTLFGVYTIVALAGVALVGRYGWRRHRFDPETTSHDFDSPGDRHRFLGFATLLLSGLGAVATLYTASVGLFLGDCR
jgi:hypothetical protein